jgi:hypothetical protein
MSTPLPVVRNTVFGLTNALALLVVALAAYTFAWAGPSFYFIFSALSVSTGLLHLISVSAMMIVSRVRDGAFTSRLSFEVGWLSILWVMWLATGADAAAAVSGVRCIGTPICGVTQAIAAFSFLNCVILFGYISALTAAAVKAGQSGKNIWSSDIKEVQLAQGAVINLNNTIANTIKTHTAAAYPPGSNPNSGTLLSNGNGPNYGPPVVSDPNYGSPFGSDPNYGSPFGSDPNSGTTFVSDPNYGAPAVTPQETGEPDYSQYGGEPV